MKEYPTIPKEANKDLYYYVFGKHDGSNIRGEWTKKNGFTKFGTRHQLLDPEDTSNKLQKAVPIIQSYSVDISKILSKLQIDKATLFFEFFGPNSFAGNHLETDNFKAVLFDVDIYKKGLMMPDEFLKNIQKNLDPEITQELLYQGKINQELITAVKNSTLENMPLEGVVAKARNPKKTLMPIMFKIKSNAWLHKLKNFCGDDANLYRKLE